MLHREGHAKSDYGLWRPDHPDRRLQSLQDWYGAGVLYGLTGESLLVVFPKVNWFCGKMAAEASYLQGIRDGRKLRA